MPISKLGIIFVSPFLLITIGGSIILQFSYGDDQWIFGFMAGGLPWSISGLDILFFAESIYEVILSLMILFGGYVLNAGILYYIGLGIEKLYKKYHS